MKFSTLVAAVATATSIKFAEAAKESRTFGILEFGGGDELMRCRLDPIVNPGSVAGHMHSIFGGNAFKDLMPGDEATKATCTTARVKQDKSNYWTPSLYFKDPKDDKLYPVKLYYSKVYYFFEPTDDEIVPFPAGFRMRSGDPTLRKPPSPIGGNMEPKNGDITPVKWTCPQSKEDKDAGIPIYPPSSDGKKGCGVIDPQNSGEGWGFPDAECSGLYSPMRADIHFPSCVKKNFDVENWQENTAWPTNNGNYGQKQNCPDGYIHVPHLFMEIYWDTQAFSDRWTKGDGKQPWVLSNGDTTGYSLHADFINGWDETTLKNLIDNCDAKHAGLHSCLPTEQQSTESDMRDCKLTCSVDDASSLDKVGMSVAHLFGNNELIGYQEEPYIPAGGVSLASAPKASSSVAVAPKPSTTFSYVTKPVVEPPVVSSAPIEPQAVVENVVVVTNYEIVTEKYVKTVVANVNAAATPCPTARRRRHARHIGRHQHGSY